MAAGDVFSGIASVEASAFLNIQPAAGAEAVIHNIYYGGPVEFYVSDGTNSVKFDSDASAGARLGMVFHVANSLYLQVKNAGSAPIVVAYDGVQTK